MSATRTPAADPTPPPTPRVTFLVHNRVRLALHHLRDGEGRSLLLLPGLGDRSPARVPDWASGWPGPVHALDFTGHGASTLPAGGGYSAELLLADADAALAELGEVTVLGRGLGAYIALQLAGGAIGPTSQSFVTLPPRSGPPDPYALLELSRDLRPPDYATLFVRLALDGSGLDEPISVAAVVRPPWLAAVADEVGVTTATIADALAAYAAV